jgi:putative FmdB family regulatory protein
MPTYEYVCTACDNHWEEVQKISADPLEVCPKCEKATAKRQISGGNFILKGGGWYADAYSSQPSSKDKGKSSGEGKSEGSQKSEGGDSSEAFGNKPIQLEAPKAPKTETGGTSGSGGSSSGGSSSGPKT